MVQQFTLHLYDGALEANTHRPARDASYLWHYYHVNVVQKAVNVSNHKLTRQTVCGQVGSASDSRLVGIYLRQHLNKTSNVRNNVTVRRVLATAAAVKKQYHIF